MRIHIFVFLFLMLSSIACRQSLDKTLLLQANVAFKPMVVSQQSRQKNHTSSSKLIFRTLDGGQTWQDISAGLPENFGVRGVFTLDGEVFLCMDYGLYQSSALCHRSTVLDTPIWEDEVFPDVEITGIFPGRVGPYFSSYQKGFFQKIPGTNVLLPIHNALEDKTVSAILETPDGTLFVGCQSGIYQSADGGKSWKQMFAEVSVNSLVAGNGVLVCGTHNGLLRSTDGGEHWDWVLTEDGAAYQTGFMNGRFVTITQGVYASQEEANAKGLVNRLRTSTDGGKTWQRLDKGLSQGQFIHKKDDEELLPIHTLYDIKQTGKHLFCSCNSGIFRSSDWGKNWEPVFLNNGKTMINMAVAGQVIYAVLMTVGC